MRNFSIGADLVQSGGFFTQEGRFGDCWIAKGRDNFLII
jgi:hypothetical protein